MATLGTLVVNIVSRIDGLVKGMKHGRKELKGFAHFTAGANKRIGTSFTVLAGTIGAAFTEGAFVNGLRNAAEDLDNLAKTSDKLGVAPKALVGLRHAAEQTGVATGTLDQAMQRFTRRAPKLHRGRAKPKAPCRN